MGRKKQGLGFGTVAIALATAVTALAAGSDYSVTSATHTAPAGFSGMAIALCPDGSTATGGGWETDGFSGYDLQKWATFGKRGYAVRIENDDTEPFNVVAYAVCDKTGRYSRESAVKNFADQETKTVIARCPRGTHVSGGGGQLGGDGFTVISSKPRGARAWQVKATYDGPGRPLSAVAVCDHSAGDYVARSKTQQAPLARAHPRGLIGVVILPVTATCRRGEKATGGGWSLDRPDHGISGSFPGKSDRGERIPGQAWTSRFYTQEGDPTQFTSHVLCKHD